MPELSLKAISMPSSPIRKLVPFSEEAKRQGKHVIHLNIGQPDIETPQVAIDAVKNSNLKVLEYSHSAGFESYRKDRKSTRLNSSHVRISYAVFCLKKKKKNKKTTNKRKK